MLKTKTITKEVEEVITEDIFCNRCGNSLKDSCNMNFEGLEEVSITGGYASKIGDCVNISFSLCEDCLIELFEEFKIKPTFKDVGWFSGDSLHAEELDREFDKDKEGDENTETSEKEADNST